MCTATITKRPKEAFYSEETKTLYATLTNPRFFSRIGSNNDAEAFMLGGELPPNRLAPSWVALSREIRGIAYYRPNKPMPKTFVSYDHDWCRRVIDMPEDAMGKQNYMMGFSHLKMISNTHYIAQGVKTLRHRNGSPILAPTKEGWYEVHEYGLPTGRKRPARS